MAKVYVTKCVVKKDKKLYQKGAVIKDLSAEEIQRGIAEHWLESVGIDEEPANVEDHKTEKGGGKGKPKDKTDKKNPEKSERDQLLEKAVDLGILDKITDETTAEEIQRLIAEAQAQ